ncbi:SDR family oxidoreductase [Amycolatopsis sp. K13G38]|uniref:SDR family oxidoreductase n=1 Tax=Amycolatopsis acididurans TaxID=2724524 RepID=A0ABX1J9C5_9PSEU|nr:SDR family NAD(P)-dependent oxidoreductase [Amycolatopsis acididurans]NKQ56149.1 SDR family oxidoreductase [Amycolatopsis acididurans]
MTATTDRFAGKVAVVTGAASGIGAGITRRLVAEGARVVGGDIAADGLKALGDELGDAFAGVPTDVTVEDQVEHMVHVADKTWGALHVAFNVAGSARLGPVAELAENDWDYTVDLVLKGQFLSAKHEARLMRRDGGGAIVLISSLNAHVPMFGGSPYAAAKAGAEMLTKNAALELARHGIRVNAILPGLVDTPATAGFLAHPQLRADFIGRIPLGRPADTGDIAGPALYLASDDARYITGTSLVVDGGWEITGYPDLSKYL